MSINKMLFNMAACLMLFCVFMFTACGGGSGESSGGSTDGASTTKAITSFYFTSPAATGIIDHVNHTINVTVPYGTDVTGLIASFATTGTSVRIVETGLIQTAGTTSNNFLNPLTYQVIAADNSTQNYTVTVTVAANNAKSITSFIFPSLSAEGVINEVNHSIMVSVPFGTSRASLSPAITHTGTAISPESGVARNFNNPVTYTVTAADNSTQNYTVTVTIAANSAKVITSFTFANPPATGVINETNHTINVEVPYGTNITSLVPAIIHTGASISPASGIARNFSSDVTYTVTAADLSTQNYTVTVTIAANSAKSITAFDFLSPATTGVINETNHTITIAVPYETDVTSLTPVITHTGASISPVSGTARNFTNPVTYTVTAVNSSTQSYTVTVGRLAEVTTMEIMGNLAFTLNFAGIFAEGGGNVINESDSAVTERGIAWNASGNPTVNDSKASDGSGPGEFYEASMTNLVENTTYYVRAYAINSQGTAYGNEIMFNSGFICGTEYAGGYVLYNDGNGGGLVSAMNDQSESYIWITGGTIQSTLNGNTSADIGTGQDNSDAIIAQTGHIGSAAQICLIYDDGTYSDWFLPSINELELMYYRLKYDGLGDFTDGNYWSSSEDSADDAWCFNFIDGESISNEKSSFCRIRAVRVF